MNSSQLNSLKTFQARAASLSPSGSNREGRGGLSLSGEGLMTPSRVAIEISQTQKKGRDNSNALVQTQKQAKYQDLLSLATKPLMVQGMPPLPAIPKQKPLKPATRQSKKAKNNSDLSPHINQTEAENILPQTPVALNFQNQVDFQSSRNVTNNSHYQSQDDRLSLSTLRLNSKQKTPDLAATLQCSPAQQVYQAATLDEGDPMINNLILSTYQSMNSQHHQLQTVALQLAYISTQLNLSPEQVHQHIASSYSGLDEQQKQQLMFLTLQLQQLNQLQSQMHQLHLIQPHLQQDTASQMQAPREAAIVSVPLTQIPQPNMMLSEGDNTMTFQQTPTSSQSRFGLPLAAQGRATQHTVQSNSEPVAKTLEERKQEIALAFQDETKKASQQMLKIGAENINSMNALSQSVKEAQASSLLKNKEHLAAVVDEQVTKELSEAIKGLASIDTYNQKYLTQSAALKQPSQVALFKQSASNFSNTECNPTALIEFDPQNQKQLKQVQREIRKIEREVQMGRTWNQDRAFKREVAALTQNAMSSSGYKAQKQLQNLMGLDPNLDSQERASKDLIYSIAKEARGESSTLKWHSNSVDRAHNLSDNHSNSKLKAAQQNTRLHPGQNQFTLQLPELQQRIQSLTRQADYSGGQPLLQNDQPTQIAPAVIRDVNYINVFIQPHHKQLKQLKQDRSESAKRRDIFINAQTSSANSVEESVRVEEGALDIFKGENQLGSAHQLSDQALLDYGAANSLDSVHRRSLLAQQVAAGQIDLESVISQSLEGQDFMGYINAILLHSPLFEQMAKQANKLETILSKEQQSSEENSPRHGVTRPIQPNSKQPLRNQKPPKAGAEKIFKKVQTVKSGSAEHQQQRMETQVLNEVLDQVLTGKFYYQSEKMEKKLADADLRYGKTAKYLQGMDYRQMLLDQAKVQLTQAPLEQEKIYSLDMLPVEPKILDEIFSIESIKQYESKIRKVLLATEDEDAIVTFLTQEFHPHTHLPPEHLTHTQLPSENEESVKGHNARSIDTFNTLSQKEDRHKEELERKKGIVIRNAHQKHILIKNLIAAIDHSNSQIAQLPEDINQIGVKKSKTRTLGGRRGEQEEELEREEKRELDLQEKEAGIKRMLYLCFLEMVRQISTKCKEQGLVLVKIWHSYFDQVEKQIRSMLRQIKQQTLHLTSNMESLMLQVKRLIEQKEDKELKFVDLKVNYEKTQHVLSIATRLIHNEEDRHKAGKDRYQRLLDNVLLLFPRYERYIDDKELHEQVSMVLEAKAKTIPTRLDPKAYQEVNEKIDVYEEDLVLDIDRIQRCINTKTPQGIRIEQLKQECALLQKQYDDAAMAKFHLQVEFNGAQQQSKDRIQELEEQAERDRELIREQERQIKTLNQQVKFFRDKYVNAKYDRECQTYISMAELPRNTVPTGVTRHTKMYSQASSVHQNALKLRQIEATQELIEAFKAQPPLEKVYTPIRAMMKVVREGKSPLGKEFKSVKKTLQMIGNIVQAKIIAMEKNDKYSLMNMDHYYYEYMNNRFGLGALAKKYCEVYLVSFQKHREVDSRIELFRKFIGLDRDRLPYSLFCAYVRLVKSANFAVSALYSSNVIQGLYVEYNYAKTTLSGLVHEAAPYIQNIIQQQLKRYAKVLTDNKRLSQGIEVSDYQVFKELIEKIAQSKYRNINDFVTPLYQTVPFVSIDKLRDYILSKFDFGPYTNPDAKTRVHAMVKTFFVEGLEASANNIPKDGLMQTVRTKFEMKLPVSAYLHIGMNAVIEHENNENTWMEGIYQFYSTVETDYVQQELGQFLRQSYAVNGLSFEQFVYFLNDCECAKPQTQIIDIYRTTCEQHYRILMACDDFIEACQKYKLVGEKKVLETNKVNREKELKRLQNGIRSSVVATAVVGSDIAKSPARHNSLPGSLMLQFGKRDSVAPDPSPAANQKEEAAAIQKKALSTLGASIGSVTQSSGKPASGVESKKLHALQNIKRQSSTVSKMKSVLGDKSSSKQDSNKNESLLSSSKQEVIMRKHTQKNLKILKSVTKELQDDSFKSLQQTPLLPRPDQTLQKLSREQSLTGESSQQEKEKRDSLASPSRVPGEPAAGTPGTIHGANQNPDLDLGEGQSAQQQQVFFNGPTRSEIPMFKSLNQAKPETTFYSQQMAHHHNSSSGIPQSQDQLGAAAPYSQPNSNPAGAQPQVLGSLNLNAVSKVDENQKLSMGTNTLSPSHSQPQAAFHSDKKRSKYFTRTTFSKINLEIISRDEDLRGSGEEGATDEEEILGSEGDEIARLNSMEKNAFASNGFKEVHILLTGSRESENENENLLQVTHTLEQKSATPKSSAIGLGRSPKFQDRSHQFQSSLEPIIEEQHHHLSRQNDYGATAFNTYQQPNQQSRLEGLEETKFIQSYRGGLDGVEGEGNVQELSQQEEYRQYLLGGSDFQSQQRNDRELLQQDSTVPSDDRKAAGSQQHARRSVIGPVNLLQHQAFTSSELQQQLELSPEQRVANGDVNMFMIEEQALLSSVANDDNRSLLLINNLDQMEQSLIDRRQKLTQTQQPGGTLQLDQQRKLSIQITGPHSEGEGSERQIQQQRFQQINQLIQAQQQPRSHTELSTFNPSQHQAPQIGGGSNEIIIQENEQLINWNDSPIPNANYSSKNILTTANQVQQSMEKSIYRSGDSTLEMVLNRKDTTPIRSQTLEILSALRTAQLNDKSIGQIEQNKDQLTFQEQQVELPTRLFKTNEEEKNYNGGGLLELNRVEMFTPKELNEDQTQQQELLTQFPGSSTILQAEGSEGKSQLLQNEYSLSSPHYDQNIRQSTPQLAATASINGARGGQLDGFGLINAMQNVRDSGARGGQLPALNKLSSEEQSMGRLQLKNQQSGKQTLTMNNSQARRSLENTSKILFSSQTGKESLNYTDENSIEGDVSDN